MTYHQPPPQPHRVTEKRGANHGLHIFLSIITCGMWAITGWPIAAALGRKKTVTTYTPPPGYNQQPPQYGPPPGQYPPQQ